MNNKIKIGVMDETVASLKGGPKVFMARLKEAIIRKGFYCSAEYDKWINLSFKEIPDFVKQNKENIQVIIRFDGVWNESLIPKSFIPKIMNRINTVVFKYLNKKILTNYKLADKVIYQSEFSKYATERLLFERFKLAAPPKINAVIYNGVDLDQFKPMTELKEKDGFPNILISHRLMPIKRAHQAPLIIEKLVEKYPNLKVHVVGEGVKNPYYFGKNSKEKMKKEIKRRNLEKYFKFYGHIEPIDLAKTYNKCDFMLNLSYADPCPNVVIEAIACGLPVIAPNHGGIPELVGNQDLLVDENINIKDYQPRYIYRELPIVDANLYVEKIENILKFLGKYSEEMRNRALEKFDISKVTDEYIDFICK